MNTPETPHSNFLAGEKSPYLLQHAHNPVEWYPWGEEAFARARRENKPIFLSIGYSTCHWCHVMARESFENPEIARAMNADFINIKVDREERPDVDRLYMAFVQATTGHGGWPMSVWLTPELRPFVGGTYFPPVDRYGRAGFLSVLQRIAQAWQEDREQIVAQSVASIDALQNAATVVPEGKPGAIIELGLERGYRIFERMFDSTEGGWGEAPKFPRPSVFFFLFREYVRRGAHTTEGRHAAEMALLTLKKMAAGGVHDHLGGGFHRYSVDEFWHVPHFEKMLYDQAQLAVAYLEAFQLTGEADYAGLVRDILDYVRRDMSDPLGGFYSAEDADSLVTAESAEHAEGAFYVWKQEEIEATLGPQDAQIFSLAYGVQPRGNAPAGSDPQGEFAGKNILIRQHPLSELADQLNLPAADIGQRLELSRQKLLAVRTKRPRPQRDDKIITAWNGLMISALARAYQVLGEPSYLESAQSAARFAREHLTAGEESALLRNYRQGPGKVAGFADDYAFLIQGLLDLYEADFDAAWLRWAIRLQEAMDARFLDSQHGGYFGTQEGDASILVRLKEDYDGAEPSANSIAAMNLQRLAAMTGREAWQEQAERIFQAFSSSLAEAAVTVPQLLAAADFSLIKPAQIVLAGETTDPHWAKLLTVVHEKFRPHKVLLHARDTEALREAPPLGGKATAYVCTRFTCQAPTNDPAELQRQLAG